MDFALIGGTGMDHLSLDRKKDITVDTPYGAVSLQTGEISGVEMVFLRRHGSGHTVPPHRINYRGNIWALKKLGVRKILATGAVGSIYPDYRIGDIVLVDQFLDFTKNRPQTFFDGGERGVLHVDVSEPYCPDLRKTILFGAQSIGVEVKTAGVYVCTEGPRFETPAEIKMYSILGGHLVGMTGVPEVVLARELGICYAAVALVTNEAAGISKQPLTHAEVTATMNMLGITAAKLINSTCRHLTKEQYCYCLTGGTEAGLF
ncbi:MAG: S-methyl-5'-thioinosine phosphorylase [Candidatus Dichloromethanomonas elyunquensis]|nr:MAG: S-methyl-5'-thioinosine phosphorylase [Candidatus Dichloromethanomonas elyunquensis]